MLKYLIVQLCDSATSFCFYKSKNISSNNLISLDNLKVGLLWAMKENLIAQFVYPNYALPNEYYDLIDTVEHVDIKAGDSNADIPIYNGIKELTDGVDDNSTPKVLRLSKKDFFENVDIISKYPIINIIITDIYTLDEREQKEYKNALLKIARSVKDRIMQNELTHVNLLTSRIQLSSMNNCNAGVETITLAPDGNFYICPAFYFDKEACVGNPINGLEIPNSQLYKMEFSPICKKCDSYQCKRCVWLNKKMTYEVNIPGHEQCVTSHIERNASKELLETLKEAGAINTDITIEDIDYLDPFDKF